MPSRVSYRILSWEGGGETQDGSRMIVASVRKYTHAHISMGSGGMSETNYLLSVH